MRAERIQQRDLLGARAGAFEILEQPRDQPLIRRGAGDVGVDDADAAPGLKPLAQRRRADGRLERGQHGGALVGQRHLRARLDHGDVGGRQIEVERAAAVSERDFHGGGASEMPLARAGEHSDAVHTP